MNEVLHANIFFVITSIAVIVFTLLLSIALFHLIKILKTMRRIVDRIDEGTETIREDFEQLRTYVTEESFLARFFKAATRGRSSTSGTRRESERKKTKAEFKNNND